MMPIVLSPDNERFLCSQIDAGRFNSANDAINELVSQFRVRYDELREQIEEGFADIAAGNYTDYDEAGLRAFFDDLVRDTRQAACDNNDPA